MASSSRINLEVDVFLLLKHRGVHLKSHVANSLRFCGYCHVRTLACFDRENGIADVEDCIRRNLAKPSRLDKLTNDERRATFGDYFADDPTEFNFFLETVKRSEWQWKRPDKSLKSGIVENVNQVVLHQMASVLVRATMSRLLSALPNHSLQIRVLQLHRQHQLQQLHRQKEQLSHRTRVQQPHQHHNL